MVLYKESLFINRHHTSQRVKLLHISSQVNLNVIKKMMTSTFTITM